MKKVLEIMAFALVALPLIGGNIKVDYSGPSGQGDMIFKAKSTGTTNLAMGTGGLYHVTLDGDGGIAATVTKETGAVTAAGANSLITPTATVTYDTTTWYDSTGAAITNSAGDSVLVITNVMVAISPDLASNAVVAVTVTGGGAVMTNATVAITAP